ncbi:MAG: urea carboxylase-associated family protein [Pseudonocardia sp.]|nr:urea carboxylase-associated family protein [Pseudonocardia sp.]
MEARDERVWVPAGEGRAVRVRARARVRVVDPQGGQVGDLFAFNAADPSEHHSAGHTRAHTSRLFPAVGEQFVTNRRRPILTLLTDDSPGHHDMLIPACDSARYAALGASDHASCVANLCTALGEVGLTMVEPPQPINVFMDIPVAPDGRLRWLPAPTGPGDSITFRAEMDCVLVLSACPQDLAGINAGEVSPLALDLLPEE